MKTEFWKWAVSSVDRSKMVKTVPKKASHIYCRFYQCFGRFSVDEVRKRKKDLFSYKNGIVWTGECKPKTRNVGENILLRFKNALVWSRPQI